MATITIRGLDEGVKARLRSRVAEHGRSMEAEARELLKTSLATREVSGREFLASIRAIVEPLGGIDLPAFPWVREDGVNRLSFPNNRANDRN